MTEKRAPWLKWYPADWRADPRLRMCSLAARGLWIEILGYMHEGDPYGHLAINGRTPQAREIAALVGAPVKVVERALEELRDNGVFSVTDAGLIYSRRMVRDKEKAEADRTNGSRGGNPRLREAGKPATETGGLTQGDKAQRPEARDQRLEARDQREGGAGAPPPPSPDRVPRGSLVPIDAPSADLLAIPPSLDRRRATRLPEGWVLPEDWRHRAIDARHRHGMPAINLDLEAEKFANYWHAQPGAKGTKLDWAATWQNWALRADGLGRGGVNGAPQMDDAALERELDRRMGGR